MNLITKVKTITYLTIIATLNLCAISSGIAEDIDPAGGVKEYISQEKNEDLSSEQGLFLFLSQLLTTIFTSKNSYVSQILIATFASVVGAISGVFVTERNIMSDFNPRKLKDGERKNTILLIGLGRTGKTQLIKRLAQPSYEERVEITNDFEIYSCSTIDHDKTKFTYDITDYRGQDFSQLISNFIKEQRRRKTKLRYGDINTLIFMVDLFSYKENEDLCKPYNEIDNDRIRDNITQWNRTAIDAIFGLLTQESLNYVCLFINKVDKLKADLSRQQKAELAKDAYKPLIKDLRQRTSQLEKLKKFQIIVGSVFTGEGVTGDNSIYSDIAIYSVPLNDS